MGKNEVISWLLNVFVNNLIENNYDKEKALRSTIISYTKNTMIYSSSDLIGFIQEAEFYDVEDLIRFVEGEYEGK